MKDSTFVKYFKKYYPLGYDSLENEFISRIRSDSRKESNYKKKKIIEK